MPGLSEQRRARIEDVVRRDVTSLEAVARCEALPAGHALRQGAGSLSKAFTAVTSGPVTEEALELAEVSRRSPLAPWKLLVRAIAALYQRDKEACRRYVEAIEPASAPARLKPALLSLLDGTLAPPLTSARLPAQARLVARISGNLGYLRGVLRETDKALDRVRRGDNPARVLRLAREAMRTCGETLPALAAELREHLLVRLGVVGVRPSVTNPVLGRVSPDSPNLFRLMALAQENRQSEEVPLVACGLWDEFRRRALRAGWFTEKSLECAALYLHMAGLLERLSAEDLSRLRRQAAERWRNAEGEEALPVAFWDAYIEESDLAIAADHLAALLEQERAARSYPASPSDRPPYVAQFAPVCTCPICRQTRGRPAFQGDADEPPLSPPEMVRELERMLAGMEPEEALAAIVGLADCLGIPLPSLPLPGRKKRKRRYEEEDDPF